jgi:CBS domain-containing protein
MTVNAILKAKGSDVVTIGPDETIQSAAALLTARRIGAIVVVDARDHVVGVLSERDIVRGIAQRGATTLNLPVRSLMTGEVVVCHVSDRVGDIMSLMTERRFRHLPVVEGERLVGMVSIGDVVKTHVAEKELEADALRRYIAAR